MQEHATKTVLITGASSGIGEAIARRLAKDGHRLMLAARRTERLEALAAELNAEQGAKQGAENNIALQACDVTAAAAVRDLVEQTCARFGGLDVMINNAGVMPLSFLSQGKLEEWERMVDVNLKGVLFGIHAALPHFRSRRSGHFINVASIAGHIVFPAGAVYCATKHAVRALTEGLRQEETAIRTTLISPGAVATELTDSISDAKVAAATRAAYEEALPAEQVAEAVAWAIAQPAHCDVNEIVLRPVSQRA